MRLAKRVEVVLGEVDLSPAQYRLLGSLADGPEGASRLARSLAITKPSLTGIVDGLVARKLVDRHDDPSDRRRVALTLTGAGRRILAHADRSIEQRLDEILSSTSEDDAALARRGLAAWRAPLDEYRDARASLR
jgi:DNA-binding MarR family transcriptional regulator